LLCLGLSLATAGASLPAVPAPQGASELDHAAALRRQGRWPEALAAFRHAWASSPAGPDKTAALAYGRMALLAGDPAAAVDPLRETADSAGPLAPFGRLLLTQALLDLGRAKEAEGLAVRLAGSPVPSLRLRALRLLARAQEAQGRLTPRLETLSRLVDLSRGADRDRVRWERALGLLQLERWREAGGTLRDLYLRPDCVLGREAGLRLNRLAEEGHFAPPTRSADQTLDLARRFLKSGRREDAWDLLLSLPAKAFEGASGERAALLRVEVLHALRRNDETVQAADALARARGNTEAALRARLKAAWALVREGDHGAVAERCRALLEIPAKGHEGLHAEALNAWAVSAYAAGNFEEAQDAWARLDSLGGGDSLLLAACLRRGWALHQLGRWEESLSLFRSVVENPGAGLLRSSALWGLASAAGRSGRRDVEVEALLRLAAGPEGYWRASALRRLGERGEKAAQDSPAVLPEPWTEAAGGEESFLARALDRAGLESDAADAFSVLYRKAGSRSPHVALTYALLCGRAGRRAAAESALHKAAPGVEGPWACPNAVLEAFYPAPLLGKIRPLAKAEGVPPALVLAVMLQESGFDETALSPAGARGLMQLMPETALRLAPHGEDPGDLYDPGANAALGIRYLGLLLNRFPTAGAVAAYNAGEDVVARWMAAWNPSCEEDFVAMIPYAETRAYTARVLAYSRDYGRLLNP